MCEKDPYLCPVDTGSSAIKLRETSLGGGELRNMLIGDSVTYDGRTHVVVGFTPTSVKPAQVELSDPQTGTTFWVDLPVDRELDAPERAALRLVRDDQRPRRR